LSDQSLPDIPVPTGWAKNVKSAVLHVISLANLAIVAARGWTANSLDARVRLSGENDRLQQEVQLLREELRIKDARLAKIDPRHRPCYPPVERMAILELKAARGWSLAQTARVFLIEAETIRQNKIKPKYIVCDKGSRSPGRSIMPSAPARLTCCEAKSHDKGELPARDVTAAESTRTEYSVGTSTMFPSQPKNLEVLC